MGHPWPSLWVAWAYSQLATTTNRICPYSEQYLVFTGGIAASLLCLMLSSWCQSRSSWDGLQTGQTRAISPSLLFLHSTVQQRGFSPFPASLVIVLTQDSLHLQFRQYFALRSCFMLSLQIERQPSSPSSCPSGLLWKDGLLKDTTAISIFPQIPGASNLLVFDFLSSADTGIHLGDHFTRSISPTDWKGLVLILLSTGEVSGHAQPCNFSPSRYFPYLLNFNNLSVAGVQVY